MDHKVTPLVKLGFLSEYFNTDDKLLIKQCCCGKEFSFGEFLITDRVEGTECPNCKNKFYFKLAIDVFMKTLLIFFCVLIACGSDAPVVETHIGYITKVEIIKTIDLDNNPVTEHYIYVDDIPYLVDADTHICWCNKLGNKVKVEIHSDGYIEISGTNE